MKPKTGIESLRPYVPGAEMLERCPDCGRVDEVCDACRLVIQLGRLAPWGRRKVRAPNRAQ